jgi:hypothetical protein
MSSTAQRHSFRRWAVLALAISLVVGVVQYAVGYVFSLDPPFLLALPAWLLGSSACLAQSCTSCSEEFTPADCQQGRSSLGEFGVWNYLGNAHCINPPALAETIAGFESHPVRSDRTT